MRTAAQSARDSKAAVVGLLLVVVGATFVWTYVGFGEPLLVSGAVGFGGIGIGLLVAAARHD